MYAMFLIARM